MSITFGQLLGEVLTGARKQSGHRQCDIARQMGFKSPTSLSKIETGSTEITVLQLYSLCELVEISPLHVLTRAEAMVKAIEAEGKPVLFARNF